MGFKRHRRHLHAPGREDERAAADGAHNGVLKPGEAVAILATGVVVACQPLPWGSNYTYALVVEAPDGRRSLGIYKPRRGEIPLWDFPDGTLYRRERAAYLFSQHLGWDFVPPTIIRDGPFGIGSVQLYVEPRENSHYGSIQGRRGCELRMIAVFDVLANNADRKAGHFIEGHDGRLWGIDHGLTFNVAPKLRTVIWEYGGAPIPEPLLAAVRDLAQGEGRLKALLDELEPLLLAEELRALERRIERLLAVGRYPTLDSRRGVPWPYF